MRDFILGYLINAAWEAPLVAAAVFLLLRFARLDARERCWAGIGCLALAVILPALDPRLAPSLTPPALPEAVAYAVAPPLQESMTEASLANVGPQLSPAAVSMTRSGAAPAFLASTATAPAAAQGNVTLAPLVGNALVWLFLAAMGLGAARLVLGLVVAHRLAASAELIELPARVLAPMKRLAVTQGRKPPQVRVSPGLGVPAAVGGWSPMILVPADFERHGEEAMIAALLHECAHVVRGDYAVNLVCELLALPMIWHPALHLIKSQVQADREAACDRLAATQMPAQRYASCLVALAGAMSPDPRLTMAAMQPLFGRGELERRVRALLEAPLEAARERIVRAMAIGGPAFVAVIALGLVLHVEPALAQPAPPPVPPAPPSPESIPAAPPPPAPPAAPAAPSPPQPAEAPLPPAKTKHVHVVQHSVQRWTSEDAKAHVVVSDDDRDLSEADQARLDADVAAAKVEAAKARAYVHSPEFRARVRQAEQAASAPAIAEAQAQAAKAEAFVRGVEFQREAAEIRNQQRLLVLKRGEIVAQLDKVKQILNNPDIERALKDADAAGPEVEKALADMERQLRVADARLRSIPRVPPVPPAPPAPSDDR